MISAVTQSQWKLSGPIITMKVIVSASVTKNSDESTGRDERWKDSHRKNLQSEKRVTMLSRRV